MLISHPRQFIYLKTIKTAGTSVEIFFESECVDPAPRYEGTSHEVPETISEMGVIGARGRCVQGATWYNHMPAHQVRALLGEEIWSKYFKFCVIRNPFDKVVSWWWFKQYLERRPSLQLAEFDQVRLAFNSFVCNGGTLPVDRSIYTLDGQPCVDCFIRFESLLEDVRSICERLGIDKDPSLIGKYKANTRKKSTHFMDYYNDSSAAIVKEVFREEFERFGYDR